MSNDLRDVIKKELDQIPLRSAETWVPRATLPRPAPRLSWRVPVAIGGAAVVLVAALVGGRQLASFREGTGAAPGVVAGRALYLSPSFNGSGWIQIDPDNLQDLSRKPFLDIAPSLANSSATMVSHDGSTIVVSDYGQGSVKHSVYDGRTGRLRGFFVPEVSMVLDSLSADGRFALGRAGDNRTPMTGQKFVVSLADGHVVRSVPPTGEIGTIQRQLLAPDLSAIYYVVTPSGILDAPVPRTVAYSLVVQSTVSGFLSGPISLPGIAAATVVSGAAGAPTVLDLRPAVAISPDGTRLAALSGGRTLVTVDTRTLAVTELAVHRKTSLFDLLRPLVAEAKVPSDEERVSAAFTPDGRSLISFVTLMHYEEARPPTLTTRGIERIEVATGLITAEALAAEGIYGLAILPDGRSVYLIVRAMDSPTPIYLLRRLDAQTLELKAERGLPDYAELELLAAPDPQAARITEPLPTAPQRSAPGAALGAIFDSTPDYPGYPWVRDGRPVKPEEVGTFAGPAHCGWQSATFLSIGWPVGTLSTSSADARQYIRDPLGVIPNRPRGRLDLNVALPSDARPTGYSFGTIQIYLSPSEQDDAMYVVGPAGAERWVRSVPMSLCQ
jgi:hypothetical protein